MCVCVEVLETMVGFVSYGGVRIGFSKDTSLSCSRRQRKNAFMTPRMSLDSFVTKLESAKDSYEQMTRQLGDPDIMSNPTELTKLTKARASLESVVNAYDEWEDTRKQLEEAKQLFSESGDDAEMREMARAEVNELETNVAEIEERIRVLLLPKDPNDDKNIMIEIRAGTGGDEASIWAGDLVR